MPLIIFSGLIAGMVWLGFHDGQTGVRHISVSRHDNPIAFWIFQIFFSAGALWVLWLGVAKAFGWSMPPGLQ